ncbi:MAG: transglutaminase-like domain-containing protein [Bacteroides sp.]|nr:transglutaminase-like domain-containing protein [Bacteroides sp.]
MKAFISLLITAIVAASCNPTSKESVPVVKYASEKIAIKFGDQVFDDEIPSEDLTGNDTIHLRTYNKDFVFGLYTDIDSLERKIPLNTTFLVKLVKETHPPLVFAVKNGLDMEALQFDQSGRNSELRFKYDEDINSPYLKKLRSECPIDSLAALGSTELDKARIIATWVHGLWEHDGWNEPQKSDALYILEQVKKGQRFRCVEYGVVTTACLNAIGLKSRTLALRTKDAETRPSGAGHVLMEVFINELDKWIMIDPQYDMITFSNGIPLNAVELQQAITDGHDINMVTSEEAGKSMYISWIYPYLYYFVISFDNRENISSKERLRINDKTDLMLVPLGAKEPTVFQQKYPIDYCVYTHSLEDFYHKP